MRRNFVLLKNSDDEKEKSEGLQENRCTENLMGLPLTEVH